MNKRQLLQNVLWFFLFFLAFSLVALAVISKSEKVNPAFAAESGYPAPGSDLSVLPQPSPTYQNICDLILLQAKDLVGSKKEKAEKDYSDCLDSIKTPENNNSPKLLPPSNLPDAKGDSSQERARKIAGEGIISYGVTPAISPSLFIANNLWVTRKGNEIINVFAGIVRVNDQMDITQGGVFVHTYDSDLNQLPGGGVYQLSEKTGGLSIIDAIGDQVVMVSEQGYLYYFDVKSMSFIADNDKKLNKFEKTTQVGTILENEKISYGSDQYEFSNQWKQQLVDKTITIRVGREKGDITRAVLVMIVSSQNQNDQVSVYYFPDTETSKINKYRIMDEIDNKIHIAGRRGEFYVFDIVSQRFLERSEIDSMPIDQNRLDLEEEIRSK